MLTIRIDQKSHKRGRNEPKEPVLPIGGLVVPGRKFFGIESPEKFSDFAVRNSIASCYRGSEKAFREIFGSMEGAICKLFAATCIFFAAI